RRRRARRRHLPRADRPHGLRRGGRRPERPVIASVSGRVATRDAELVVVEVGGVGLEVLPTRAAASVAQPGTVVTLATHLHVREDGLTLYGFAGQDERRLFRLLLGVTGVGPKLALAIVSAYPPAQLERAVAAGDVNLLASVVGV